MSKRVAALEVAMLTLVGWLLSFWLGMQLFAIASAVIVGLFLYSTYLKSTVVWGNLMVSALAASAFPYGAVGASGIVGRAWLPASFAFLFHFGREILKDMEDVTGDRRRGVATLALRIGPKGACVVSTALFVVLMGVTLAPWVLGMYGVAYLVVIGLLDALLVLVAVKMIRGGGHLTDQRLSQTLTVGMFMGLLAIVLGEAL